MGKKLKNDLSITELPWYAINKSLPADSYFTSEETAKKCYDVFLNVCKEQNINVDDYSFIEPGAGQGGFFDLLPKNRRIGIDIIDRRSDIITADFLKWIPDNVYFGKYLTIGNPPFGIRGAYALAFLNRSLIFSDMVGFILPMSFHSNGKGTNMMRVSGQMVYSEMFENERFYSPDNDKEIQVNILFQIWKPGINDGVFKKYDISKYAIIRTVNPDPRRYCGMDQIDEYDFFVNSTFYEDREDVKVVYKFEDVKYSSGYGIIIKKNKKELLERIKQVNWINYSSLATNSCRHIRMHHIKECFTDMGFGRDITLIDEKINKFIE